MVILLFICNSFWCLIYQFTVQRVIMAMRSAARYVSRRFSTGGKIFSEEEKAAENIYIKVTSRYPEC